MFVSMFCICLIEISFLLTEYNCTISIPGLGAQQNLMGSFVSKFFFFIVVIEDTGHTE